MNDDQEAGQGADVGGDAEEGADAKLVKKRLADKKYKAKTYADRQELAKPSLKGFPEYKMSGSGPVLRDADIPQKATKKEIAQQGVIERRAARFARHIEEDQARKDRNNRRDAYKGASPYRQGILAAYDLRPRRLPRDFAYDPASYSRITGHIEGEFLVRAGYRTFPLPEPDDTRLKEFANEMRAWIEKNVSKEHHTRFYAERKKGAEKAISARRQKKKISF